ncbi:MAG: hypothetical protein IPK82_40665 [Polyangiaceae bacterium]|nr:hypothetical protein [Polyangiaceae bacterium]
MIKLPSPGLYRTTKPYPGMEEQFPANCLVYVGQKPEGATFVVRPGSNRRNRWFWGEPVTILRSVSWGESLKPLRAQGFYTLPEDIDLGGGGKWLKNAIVQLGYNTEGRAILFVGEDHESEERNILVFSEQGILIDDKMMDRLNWAPILPVKRADVNEAT